MDITYEVLESGIENVVEYLSQHVLTCLIPAFFIAGAIAAFVKKDAILNYFGPDVKKRVSYPIASVSGAILAVCSCTILPLFAGIYKKGSGIGPATAFLYSGPAINILAITYTAQVLGYDLALARAVSAVGIALVVGFLMSNLFSSHDAAQSKRVFDAIMDGGERKRPLWASLGFFGSLVAILVIGASKLPWIPKLVAVYFLTIIVAVLLIYFYKREDVTEWGYETWNLTKKIFPILVGGTFIVGIIAYFLPPESFQPYLGNNSLSATFLGSIIGGILYMPTLLEVPIIGTTFGYTSGLMGAGPALSLLLAGPALSLPNMIVIYRIVGVRKATAYIVLVVFFSTLAGAVYGNVV